MKFWLVCVVIALVAAAAGLVAGILVTRSDDDLQAKYGVVGVNDNISDEPLVVYEPRVVYRDSGSIARVEGYNGCSTDSERIVLVNPLWFTEIATRERWLGQAGRYCD